MSSSVEMLHVKLHAVPVEGTSETAATAATVAAAAAASRSNSSLLVSRNRLIRIHSIPMNSCTSAPGASDTALEQLKAARELGSRVMHGFGTRN